MSYSSIKAMTLVSGPCKLGMGVDSEMPRRICTCIYLSRLDSTSPNATLDLSPKLLSAQRPWHYIDSVIRSDLAPRLLFAIQNPEWFLFTTAYIQKYEVEAFPDQRLIWLTEHRHVPRIRICRLLHGLSGR